jgi:branched-chain amino acid transport system permease protein
MSDKVNSKLERKSNTDRGKWIKPGIYGIVVLILALFPVLGGTAYMLHVLVLCFIYIIAASSFRTITISGQFPLAHAAFMGIGGYVAGMASKWLDWSPIFTFPAAAIFAAAIGMIIGYPFSRLRALYYAMGSLFFGIGIIQIVYAIGEPTGGYSGLVGIHGLFGGSREVNYYFFLALTVVCLLALYRFEFCRIGTTLKAINQSHIVASSVGINEGWYRILAVGVGCFFAGIAGAGYAHYNLVLSPSSFGFLATLWIVMYALIGGIENFAGPIIGTFILILIPEFFRDLKMFSPFISAGLLAIVVYLMPKGLVSLPEMIKSWITERRKDKGAIHAS